MKKITLSIFVFYLLCISVFAQGKNVEQDPDPQWTIINIYQVQNSASGLAWDGEFFYIGSYGGVNSDKVYKFNPSTATNEYLFTSPESTFGMTWDGTHLWITHPQSLSNPSRATKMDLQGNIVDNFNLPARMMSGIAYDNGDFWAARYESPFHKIYNLQLQDGEYVAVDSFPTPSSQPWEIARQGDDILWVTDYYTSVIHKMDLEGNLITTYPAALYRTSGVVFDGQYLWYLARSSATGSPSYLYQVDLEGSGAPEVVVDQSHDFGNVTLEGTSVWSMEVSNPGTGQLTIDDMVFDGNTAFSTNKTFPFNIAAGQSDIIEISFAPTQINHQDITAVLHTNDPANLQVNIYLEGIGLESGSYLFPHQEEIDFGVVRVNSSNKKYFVFQNLGDAELEISQVQLGSDLFYFDGYVDFPYLLQPVETIEIPFWFLPAGTGPVEATATVLFNNEEQSPLIINLSGNAQSDDYAVGDLLWQYQLPGPVWNHATSVLSVPDLNEDGKSEVMLTTRTGHLRVFNSNASGEADLIWERHLGIVDFPKAVALASDINGDGLNDIIAGTGMGDMAITAVSSRTGEDLWRVETNSLPFTGWVYMVDVSHDFNDDGYLDVVAAIGNTETGTGSVICLNGLNGEILWHTQLGAAVFTVMVAEDFTGDGIPDVVAGSNAPSNKGKVVAIDGQTGAIEWEIEAASSVRALGQLNDITENGTADIIAGTLNGIFYLIDATSGDIQITGSTNTRIYDFYDAGDLNFNGHPSFIPSAGLSNNLNAICGKTGSLIWTLPMTDIPIHVAIIPDITGDGRNDIAVGTRPNNDKIYLVNGNNGTLIDSFDLDQGAAVVNSIGDINGNGNVEIITSTSSGFLGVFSLGPHIEPVEYTLAFEVKNDEGQPMQGATIIVTGLNDELTTDAQGMASTELFPGSYDYSVSLVNHNQFVGNVIIVDADVVEQITLQSPQYSVTFIVTSQDSPLANVSIEVSAAKAVAVTDANGIASLDLPGSDYTYLAQKEFFFPASGEFQVVDQAIVVNINMVVDETGVGHHQNTGIRSYPNPFSGNINVEYWLNDARDVTITLYHSNGGIVYSQIITDAVSGANRFSWDTSAYNLKHGVYFLEIKSGDIIYRERLIYTGR